MSLETDRKSTDRLKVEEGQDHQHYLSRVAGNNRVRWTSEGYTREFDAWRAAWDSADDIAEDFAPPNTRPGVQTDASGQTESLNPESPNGPGIDHPAQPTGVYASPDETADAPSDPPPDEVAAAELRDRITASAELEIGHSNLPEVTLEEGGNPFAPPEE